jgi:NADH pyrophosphatase NudC (nudix superfamily)
MAERKRGKPMAERKPAAQTCPGCGAVMEIKAVGEEGIKYRCPKCNKKLYARRDGRMYL